MKKALYGFFVILGLIGGFAYGTLNAAAQNVQQAISLDKISALPGYRPYITLSSFTKQLQSDRNLYQALSSNQKLSEKIMGSTSLQRQLLSDIKKAGESQQVISSYLNELNNNGDLTRTAFSQRENAFKKRMEKQRQQRTELNQNALSSNSNGNSQSIGPGVSSNASLAAQRAIEHAQQQKEAAYRRAADILEQVRLSVEGDAEQAKFEAEILQFKKIQDMVAQLANKPGAVDAFFADRELIQKIMDNEITIAKALEKYGVTPESYAPGDNSQPQDDSIFGNDFEDPDEPENGLVHVYGNKYKIDGRKVYDLNHVPSEQEMALDENGWPKFLNVPAECGPANPDVTYFFESRYGLGQNNGIVAGGAMNFLNPRGFPQGNRVDVGLTDSEQFAVPFFTPNNVSHTKAAGISWADFRFVYLPDLHSRLNGGKFNISISHCPGDWDRTVPEGRQKLSKKCSYTYSDFVVASNGIYVKVKNNGQTFDGGNDDRVCALEPGKRYFFNMSPPHHIDPSWPTQREYMLSVYERLHDMYPEQYPLTPEEQLANWNGPMRNGEIVKTWGTDIWHYSRKNLQLLPPMPRAVGGLVGKPKRSAQGNFYAVSTKAAPRQVTIDSGYSRCEGNVGMVLRDKTCKDPAGKLPPVRVIAKCTGNREITWIEGYNAKLFNTYVCEDTVK